MRFLVHASWRPIWLIATGWVAAWLLAAVIAVWDSMRALERESNNGPSFIGDFGLTHRGVVIVFGPPLAVLMLRLILPRFYSR